jgi:hypothetical protein
MKRLPRAGKRVVPVEMERRGNWSSAASVCAKATSLSSRAIVEATGQQCWRIPRPHDEKARVIAPILQLAASIRPRSDSRPGAVQALVTPA